jgi:hypothetical protein
VLVADTILSGLSENIIVLPDTSFNSSVDVVAFTSDTVDRYYDSVLLVNVALESFVADHLYEILNNKNTDRAKNLLIIKGLPKSLYQIFKKHFLKIDGRDFTKETELWDKFEEVRNTRTDAAHSFTKKIDPVSASKQSET